MSSPSSAHQLSAENATDETTPINTESPEDLTVEMKELDAVQEEVSASEKADTPEETSKEKPDSAEGSDVPSNKTEPVIELENLEVADTEDIAADEGTGEKIEDVKAENVVENMNAEGSIEKEDTEVSVKDVKSEGNVEDMEHDVSIQDVKSEAKVEDVLEVNMEDDKPEVGVEDVKPEVEVEDVELEANVEEAKSEAKVKDEKSEDKVEEVEPEVSVDEVKAEKNLGKVKSEVNVDDEKTETNAEGEKPEATVEEKTAPEKASTDENIKVDEVDLTVKREPVDIKEEIKDAPVLDHAATLLKKEVAAAIRVYQKYFDDLNLAQRISQPNVSNYTRAVIMRKLNASTVHIDGYHVRIEMAKTAEEFQNLLDEINRAIRRARQSQEINALLGAPF